MKTLKLLREMAQSLGKSSFSPLDTENKRKQLYSHSNNFHVHYDYGNGVKLHKSENGSTTNYFTNDHMIISHHELK